MNRPLRKLFLLMPTLLLVLSPVPAKATSVVMLSDTELVVNSRFILTGKVRSVVSAWDDEHANAWTYVKVRVDQVLKGELASRSVVLKQIGGEAGGMGMRVFGEPEFAPGQRVLLYLNTRPDGTLQVAYAFMGMFSISEDAAGQRIVSRAFDSREVEVLSRPDGEAVTDHARLDSYVERIQQTLVSEAQRIAVIDSQRSATVVTVPSEYARKKEEGRGYSADFALLGDGVRWPQPDSVTYQLNTNLSPVAGGGTAEITRALNAWPNQSGASVRLQLGGQTSSCGFVDDGVNTISFGNCLGQIQPPVGSCSGVVAQTRITWTNETTIINGRSFKRLLEADVVFNSGMNCFLGNSANLAETACHELGHSIGLDHSTDTGAIMWATVRGQGRDATLGNDDKAGVQTIYPGTSSGGGGGGGLGPVDITTEGLVSGIVNRSYRQDLSATGGTPPYRWNVIGGALPPGLTFSTSGVINGTPFTTGFFSILVMVTDSVGGANSADTKQLSLFISSDNSGVAVPLITRVKIKRTKKLWVFGENFEATSIVSLNGVFLTPKEFSQTGSTGKLFFKGQIPLRTDGGPNQLLVRNSSGWSGTHLF